VLLRLLLSLQPDINDEHALLFAMADYRHGIRLATNVDAKVLLTLNARSENDRTKFVEDLKEAILEVRSPVFRIHQLVLAWCSRISVG